MTDRPLAVRRLFASHRNNRTNLLGRVCRRRAAARHIRKPFGHRLGVGSLPPTLAPLPHRLRPYAEFPGTLAHTEIVGGMQYDARSQCQLLRSRARAHQFFQRLTLLRRNNHRRGDQRHQDLLSAPDSPCHNIADSAPMFYYRKRSPIPHKVESPLPLACTRAMRVTLGFPGNYV